MYCLSIDVNKVLLMYAEACFNGCMLIYLFINAFFNHKALSHVFFFFFVCLCFGIPKLCDHDCIFGMHVSRKKCLRTNRQLFFCCAFSWSLFLCFYRCEVSFSTRWIHVDISFLIILPFFVIFLAREWVVFCEHEDWFGSQGPKCHTGEGLAPRVIFVS